MRRWIYNRKGASLPLVIVLSAALIIISVVLADSVMQWFKIVRGQETEEYTYMAADAAIQRCFENLERVITTTDYTAGIVWNDDNDFADRVLLKINDNTQPLATRILKNYNDIEVLEYSDPKATADLVSIQRDLSVAPVETDGGMKLEIPIIVTAQARLNNGPFSSYGRKVIAKKKFKVFLPYSFQLNGAIYAIGDVMATGGIQAEIKGTSGGDVYVMGTAPKIKKQPKQYYYGGIYAKDGSKLRIDGNAFSQTFIRAGKYDPSDVTNKVEITKDAVAQSIQVFGNSSRIFVGRNAFTNDDLEVDGEDSVIAVNGSYFGMSKGNTGFHDACSSIVNAAPVHYAYSDASKKSRIVVNQDVLINGSSFKVGSDGSALFPLEEASMAWYKSAALEDDNDIPVYKKFTSGDYFSWLSNSSIKSNLNGFLNIFQMLSRCTSFSDTGIDTWFTSNIDSVRDSGINIGFGSTHTIPSKISGFSHKVIAANSKQGLYFVNSGDMEFYKYINDPADDFKIEYFKEPLDHTYWNRTGITTQAAYESHVKTQLKDLRSRLMNHIRVFGYRDYPPLDEDKFYDTFYLTNPNIDRTFNYPARREDNIDSDDDTNGEKDNLFMYFVDYIKNHYGSGNPRDNGVLIYNDGCATEIDPPTNVCQALRDSYPPTEVFPDTKYFLVVNYDPEHRLLIDDDFNGIIFTLGKILIMDGANINGAIIAAGRGYDPNDSDGISGTSAKNYAVTVSGSTSYFPKFPMIDDTLTHVSNLDNGDFAAVVFEGGGTATVSFPGRDVLLQKLRDSGVNLDTIF